MEIKIKELERIIHKVLLTKYSKKEVNFMTPIIMFGELSNTKSHGIIRICSSGENILSRKPKGYPSVIKRTRNSELIEGKGNPGMLVGAIACQEVIMLGEKYDIGVVGTKGSTSSSGSLTYYLEKIANENLIAIIMARAPSDVAPFGGLERLFGTNPISFGIPKKGEPFIFDMATSAISYGAVARAKNLGHKLPENVAVDKRGKVTTDPKKALEGAFLTFDNSYKGYGLAMIVEILAGVLPGAQYLDLKDGDGWGNLFLAINPNLLTDISDFKKKVEKLVERVRNSKSISGEKIRIPGENKIRLRNQAIKNGFVDVDEKTLRDIENIIK